MLPWQAMKEWVREARTAVFQRLGLQGRGVGGGQQKASKVGRWGRGISPGPVLVQSAPFLLQPVLLLPVRGRVLGEIVQCPSPRGSETTSYCRAAGTTQVEACWGAKGTLLEGAQGVRISFRPQTKSACGKGEKSAQTGPGPGYSPLQYSSRRPRSQQTPPAQLPRAPLQKLHVLPLLTTQRQAFPLLSQLSIDSIFYIYLKHRNV